jgi:hypothetical protein
MRYYIVTTTKFADECLKFLTYGASQSNWLANVDTGDIIFLSQFNYKSQDIFGPFQTSKKLFYAKDIIYPGQKYFYRIQFSPIDSVKCIEETDIYVNGIQTKNIPLYVRIINLIQQNKHLHCIPLTVTEGEALLDALAGTGINFTHGHVHEFSGKLTPIDREYIWQKNKLDKRSTFSSESDLESYLILSLKNREYQEYETLQKLLTKYQSNEMGFSEIYNQFIFGNAYPCDMLILNGKNINVFELKRDKLTRNTIPQIEKEIKKHLYYSIYSDRIKSNGDLRRFNFYLICSKDQNNKHFKKLIYEKYFRLCDKLTNLRENTITIVEYHVNNSILFLEEV